MNHPDSFDSNFLNFIFGLMPQPRSQGAGTTETLGTWLRTVPTKSKVFLLRFMIMQEMYFLTSAIEIQKETWG